MEKTALKRSETVLPERHYGALTAREERVRHILIQELSSVNAVLEGFGHKGLSYAEKQHIEKRLDVDYLDREIAQMKRALHATARLKPWAIGLVAVCAALFAWRVVAGDWSQFLTLAILPFITINLVVVNRSVRRRLYIFEALRALSDADEIDVILDKATRDADRLIEQIVARELEAEKRFGPSNR